MAVSQCEVTRMRTSVGQSELSLLGVMSVYVLLWALGDKDELPPSSEICDVPADVGVIKEPGTQLAQNGELRSMDEILDLADYY